MKTPRPKHFYRCRAEESLLNIRSSACHEVGQVQQRDLYGLKHSTHYALIRGFRQRIRLACCPEDTKALQIMIALRNYPTFIVNRCQVACLRDSGWRLMAACCG